MFSPLLVLALVTGSVAQEASCLASIKVIDDFLTDEEAQLIRSDVEEHVAGKVPERIVTEKPRIYLTGYPAVQRRLEEALSGPATGPSARFLKSMIPVDHKRGDVIVHQDYVNGKTEEGLVKGNSAVVYLHSAPDGASLGALFFKNNEGELVKEVEGLSKRFVSWDNALCAHGFSARTLYRSFLGPMGLTDDGEVVGVGIRVDPEPTTDPPTTPEPTTPEPTTPPTTPEPTTPEPTTTPESESTTKYHRRYARRLFRRRGRYGKMDGNALESHSPEDSVHFMQLPHDDL